MEIIKCPECEKIFLLHEKYVSIAAVLNKFKLQGNDNIILINAKNDKSLRHQLLDKELIIMI